MERFASRQRTFCKQAVKAILDDDNSVNFARPVAELWDLSELPDYPKKVPHPMDLGTITDAVESKRHYLAPDTGLFDPALFIADVRLTFLNAMNYNGDGTDMYDIAASFLKWFDDYMRDIPTEVKSSSGHRRAVAAAAAAAAAAASAAATGDPVEAPASTYATPVAATPTAAPDPATPASTRAKDSPGAPRSAAASRHDVARAEGSPAPRTASRSAGAARAARARAAAKAAAAAAAAVEPPPPAAGDAELATLRRARDTLEARIAAIDAARNAPVSIEQRRALRDECERLPWSKGEMLVDLLRSAVDDAIASSATRSPDYVDIDLDKLPVHKIREIQSFLHPDQDAQRAKLRSDLADVDQRISEITTPHLLNNTSASISVPHDRSHQGVRQAREQQPNSAQPQSPSHDKHHTQKPSQASALVTENETQDHDQAEPEAQVHSREAQTPVETPDRAGGVPEGQSEAQVQGRSENSDQAPTRTQLQTRPPAQQSPSQSPSRVARAEAAAPSIASPSPQPKSPQQKLSQARSSSQSSLAPTPTPRAVISRTPDASEGEGISPDGRNVSEERGSAVEGAPGLLSSPKEESELPAEKSVDAMEVDSSAQAASIVREGSEVEEEDEEDEALAPRDPAVQSESRARAVDDVSDDEKLQDDLDVEDTRNALDPEDRASSAAYREYSAGSSDDGELPVRKRSTVVEATGSVFEDSDDESDEAGHEKGLANGDQAVKESDVQDTELDAGGEVDAESDTDARNSGDAGVLYSGRRAIDAGDEKDGSDGDDDRSADPDAEADFDDADADADADIDPDADGDEDFSVEAEDEDDEDSGSSRKRPYSESGRDRDRDRRRRKR